MIPEDWKLLRGLVKALGLVALVLATLSLSDPKSVPGPLPVAIAAYLGTPLAVSVGALLARRRWRRLRIPATVVGVTALVVLLANVALLVTVKHWADELREDAPRGCDSLRECRSLASTKFGPREPLFPTAPTVDDFTFAYGEESGRVLGVWYRATKDDDPTLAFIVTRRRPDGFEPPTDEAAYRTTPAGIRYVEGLTPEGVNRLDFWDDSFHYAVALQASYPPTSEEYRRAVTLIDSAS